MFVNTGIRKKDKKRVILTNLKWLCGQGIEYIKMRNIESFRDYCLSLNGVTESFPFDENTLVFKVMNKLFALTGLNSTEFKVNLKCDPSRAVELRAQYPDVIPGYHMNKKHWNTVFFDGDLPDILLVELVDHSYELVVAKLTKADRALLLSLGD